MNSKQAIKIWNQVLVGACEGKTAAEQKKIVNRLEAILRQKKKEYLLPKIVDKAFAVIENRAKLEITLARHQSPELVEKLKKKIAARIEGGRQVNLAIDPEIIGGFTAKSSQYFLDASVRGYLKRLEKTYQQ